MFELKRIGRFGIACLCSCISFFIFLELGLRAIRYDYCPLTLMEPGQKMLGIGRTDWREYHSREDQFFDYDPVLIWRPKRNFKIFNEQGFKGDLFNDRKEPQEIRVIPIGDSNTLGPSDGAGWPDYLSQMLKRKNSHVRLANAGAWGYSSWQGLKRFEEVLHYRPDVISISFGGNDAHWVIIPDQDYVKAQKYFRSWVARFKIFKLWVAINDRILLNRRKGRGLVQRVGFQEYQNNLEKMIRLAKENHVQVILLTRPFIGTAENSLVWKNFTPKYNALAQKIAEREKVAIIDVYSYFKDKKEYFVDECHFNDEGNKAAAQLIFNMLEHQIPENDPMA